MKRIAQAIVSLLAILGVMAAVTILLLAAGGDSYTSLLRIGGSATSWLWIDRGESDSDLYIGTGVVAPTVTTNDATLVLDTSARFNGNLNSLGSSATVTVNFEYGTVSGVYPFSTAGEVKGTTGTFFFDQGALTASTPYYYRAKAVGSSTVYGVEKSFTTSAALAVTTNAATNITTTVARLNGTLTGMGPDTSVLVRFNWGTVSGVYPNNAGPQTMGSTGTFFYDLGSLDTSTTYFYRASALGSGGTVYGAEENFTTLTPTPVDPPTITVYTRYTDGALLSVVKPSGTLGYDIWYDTDTYPLVRDGSDGYNAGIGLVGFFDFGPTIPAGDKSNTNYYLSAWGYNSSGEWGSTHSELLVKTLPNAPLIFTATTVSDITIDLTWDTGYSSAVWTLIRARTDTYPDATDDPLSRGVYFDVGESFSDTPLDPGETYYYSAWLYNGYYGAVAQDSATTSEAPDCTTLAATNAAVTTATLNGYLDSEGGSSCWARFQYGVAAVDESSTAWVGGYHTGSYPTVNIGSLSLDETYMFRIQVYNASTGIGSPVSGDTLTFSTCSAVTHPPYLTASAVSSTSISLSWAKGSCSDTSIIRYSSIGYPTTYNSPDGVEAYKGGATSYNLGSLQPGTTYYFRIWGTESTYTYYSDNYSEAVTTTSSGGGTSVPYDFPDSTNWFTDPDCSGLTNMPAYSIIANAATGIGWDACTGFVFLIFLVAIVVGMVVLYASKGNMIAVLVAMGMILLIGVIAGPLPKVWFIIYLAFSIPAGYLLPKGASV